jgi:hypothetical protein
MPGRFIILNSAQLQHCFRAKYRTAWVTCPTNLLQHTKQFSADTVPFDLVPLACISCCTCCMAQQMYCTHVALGLRYDGRYNVNALAQLG